LLQLIIENRRILLNLAPNVRESPPTADGEESRREIKSYSKPDWRTLYHPEHQRITGPSPFALLLENGCRAHLKFSWTAAPYDVTMNEEAC